MRFIKIILIYLLIGSVIGCVFTFFKKENNYVLPFCIYVLISAYLLVLFFKGNRNLIFNSIILLFLVQVFSIKMMSFSYFFSIGFCFFCDFLIETFSFREIILSFSYSDFTPVQHGQKEVIGFNLVALFFLLLLIIIKGKK